MYKSIAGPAIQVDARRCQASRTRCKQQSKVPLRPTLPNNFAMDDQLLFACLARVAENDPANCPMIHSSSFTIESYAHEVRDRIDAQLDRYTRFDEGSGDRGAPDSLREAIRYSLLAPGKRLRPMLVLLAAEACQGSADAALPAAAAVEMIHTYSLIHDDLPAMDDDDLRRGRPTCHRAYGEATAILAGDALLALAFEVLARDMQPSAAAAQGCVLLANAAGATQLVGGQADDLAGVGLLADGLPANGSSREAMRAGLAALESIHRRKTGAMFLVSLQLGALSAAAAPHERAALETYGRKLGLAFQIVDDLLDVRGSAEALGKATGKDSGRGKLTFPGLLGIDESARRADALVAEAVSAIALFAPHAGGLEALARYVLERKH
jgi:geranylgeranyl diphosphate synthase, type II